jgi:hypothetical protein
MYAEVGLKDCKLKMGKHLNEAYMASLCYNFWIYFDEYLLTSTRALKHKALQI